MATLVVGSTGFVGSAVRALCLETDPDEYVFASRRGSAAVAEDPRSMRIDLLQPADWPSLDAFDQIIWVAGNSDHALAHRDPAADLSLNTLSILNLLERWGGSLTLLSSAAVYFGLSGATSEDTDHVPPIAYGLSKLATEQYALEAAREGKLDRLWIHRLMYAFGAGEKPRRLVSRCLRASLTGEELVVLGGGRSYINPLPVTFVAKVLVESSRALESQSTGSQIVTNLNHRDPWTTLQVVEYLSGLGSFAYRVEESGQGWPVTFWGDTMRLESWLDRWDLQMPDVQQALSAYRDATLRSVQ